MSEVNQAGPDDLCAFIRYGDSHVVEYFGVDDRQFFSAGYFFKVEFPEVVAAEGLVELCDKFCGLQHSVSAQTFAHI